MALSQPAPRMRAGNAFAEAVFAAGGVASVFGVNDFVTVTPPARGRLGPDCGRGQAAAEACL